MTLTLRMAERLLLGDAETAPRDDVRFTSVCTDSRAVESGSLFVCIEGERFDGHAFAEAAVRAGAAAVVSSKLLDLDVPVFMVRNTVQTLGLLARGCRDAAHARVLAVTGSAGKTTVKELIAAMAQQDRSVSRNAGNLNNQIGLPLSIFRADPKAALWVMELGISKPGDMDELGVVASPDMAVIHNIGCAHLEGLGDLDGVARAKASLLRHLRPDGQAVVNADHPALLREALALRPDLVRYSTTDKDSPYFCCFTHNLAEGRGRYFIRTPKEQGHVEAPFCGAHFAENLGAAATVGHLLGLDLAALQAGLDALHVPGQRFACRDLHGVTIIDDTYNANPISMHGAIRTAHDMARDNGLPLVLVLGDMKELGNAARSEHEALGALLAECRPEAVFFHGEHAEDVARGCRCNGLVRPVAEPDALLRHWRELDAASSAAGAVVLFKGSRSCRMENYAQALRRELDNRREAHA